MIKILKITYRFFILQLKIRKNTKDTKKGIKHIVNTIENNDVAFDMDGVVALNELIDRSSRLWVIELKWRSKYMEYTYYYWYLDEVKNVIKLQHTNTHDDTLNPDTSENTKYYTSIADAMQNAPKFAEIVNV